MTNADVVVRGGMLVDGTGAPAVHADLAIRDGRIVAVGPDLTGDTVVDASGCVVAPGLIDIHTHYDAQVTWDPELAPSSTLGVTSVVAGNCGYSVAPCPPEVRDLLMRTLEATEDMALGTLEAGMDWGFESYGEYLAQLRVRGLGINYGGYVGHTTVRLAVMGDDAYERDATVEEIDRMRAMVAGAIREGALGFSTNRSGALRGDRGRPIPSVLASSEETEALAMGVVDAGRGIMAMAAGDNPQWAYELATRFGRTITWNSILAFPETGAGARMNWQEKLAHHHEGRRRSPDVHPQVTSRALTFSFTLVSPLLFYRYRAFGDLPRADLDARRRAFADPVWRTEARAQMDASGYRWEGLEIGEAAPDDLLDRRVVDVARERGADPFDTMVDIALATDLAARFRVTSANGDPEAVAALLTTEGCVLGLSDAGAHVSQICDAVMPVDFLSSWVRDRAVMGLEAGVRKVTGELADVIGLEGRGYLRAGAFADVVVLDWDRLDAGPIRRVRDLPAGGERLLPTEVAGVRHVLVNGRITRYEGEVRPGVNAGMVLEPKV